MTDETLAQGPTPEDRENDLRAVMGRLRFAIQEDTAKFFGPAAFARAMLLIGEHVLGAEVEPAGDVPFDGPLPSEAPPEPEPAPVTAAPAPAGGADTDAIARRVVEMLREARDADTAPATGHQAVVTPLPAPVPVAPASAPVGPSTAPPITSEGEVPPVSPVVGSGSAGDEAEPSPPSSEPARNAGDMG